MSKRSERVWPPPVTVGKVVQKLRDEGPKQLVRRAVRRAYQQLDAGELDFNLLPGDVADSSNLTLRTPAPLTESRPIRVGWLCTPPAAGSGGHTTMFRMVRALEEAGHTAVVVLYDRHRGNRHGGNTAAQAAVIKSAWPAVDCEVRSIDDGLDGLDLVVATGWDTAHVLATRTEAVVHRAYFIQDFEPMFYPYGSEHALAIDTYRFGFANVSLGGMVHERLLELGVPSHEVTFGRDTDVYRYDNRGSRSGVAFFARPDVPRRAYRLGMLALAEFNRRNPEQEIHLYGATVNDPGFPVTMHGRPTPEQLNDLYNRCAAGLVLSFTNVSLVPDEMLAAGCVPVVNDSSDTRAVLDNPHVGWSAATPGALAEALERAVAGATPARCEAAAASVQGSSWSDTGREVVAILEGVVRGTADKTLPSEPVGASVLEVGPRQKVS